MSKQRSERGGRRAAEAKQTARAEDSRMREEEERNTISKSNSHQEVTEESNEPLKYTTCVELTAVSETDSQPDCQFSQSFKGTFSQTDRQ